MKDQDKLLKLQSRLIDILLTKLDSGEVSASDMQVIRQLLRDNCIFVEKLEDYNKVVNLNHELTEQELRDIEDIRKQGGGSY